MAHYENLRNEIRIMKLDILERMLYRVYTRCDTKSSIIVCRACYKTMMMDNEISSAYEVPYWKIQKENSKCERCKQ